MLTKGYILEKIKDSNKYKVRVPIYETAGNTSGEAIFEATLAYSPGTMDAYHPGDVVYVQFEDNDESKAVIVGKLYLGEDENAEVAQDIKTLDVSGTTNLTRNTYINGIKLDDYVVTKADFNTIEIVIDSKLTYVERTDKDYNPPA